YPLLYSEHLLRSLSLPLLSSPCSLSPSPLSPSLPLSSSSPPFSLSPPFLLLSSPSSFSSFFLSSPSPLFSLPLFSLLSSISLTLCLHSNTPLVPAPSPILHTSLLSCSCAHSPPHRQQSLSLSSLVCPHSLSLLSLARTLPLSPPRLLLFPSGLPPFSPLPP